MDQSLALPTASRADWTAEISKIRKLISDDKVSEDEKISMLVEALESRINDTKAYDDHSGSMEKRHEGVIRERGRVRSEAVEASNGRTNVEERCQSLRKLEVELKAENRELVEEEQSRHAELKGKFEEAMTDVQEKMHPDFEAEAAIRKENDGLQVKFDEISETCAKQESAVTEKCESRAHYLTELKEQVIEYETRCRELKAKADPLEVNIKGMRKSLPVLRKEVDGMMGKFDDINESATSFNERHTECKADIEALNARWEVLAKENAAAKENEAFVEATQEQQKAKKQRDMLEKLYNNLMKENQTVHGKGDKSQQGSCS